LRFLLVDQIVELDSGKRATGIKNVTLSEDFLADHFPEKPIMPGVLIAESLVQLADWVVRESSGFQQMGLAQSFERLRFRQMVQPGEQLRLEVDIVSQLGTEVIVKGKAFVADRLAAAADFTLSVRPVDPLISQEESARLFNLIRRGGDGD
jgi:3-hydroxyacyl-[acyl-carrier-protein] dehydratase